MRTIKFMYHGRFVVYGNVLELGDSEFMIIGKYITVTIVLSSYISYQTQRKCCEVEFNF